MQDIVRSSDRGHAHHGWLTSHHSFSFASYFDPRRMGFRALRVLNDDTVAPGTGFGRHGHQDMEIVTVVLSGALEHKDSMGNGSIMRAGDVQRMSAGTGVLHSEANPSKTEAAHFLQIWVHPDVPGHAPSYAQARFDEAARRGRFVPVVSGDGREGSLTWHQDAVLALASLDAARDGEAPVEVRVHKGRAAYVHVASGEVQVNGERLVAGDALALTDVERVSFAGARDAQVLLFDLA